MDRAVKFKLWDIGYNRFAPQNVFTVIGDERQIALCIKDWETVKEGEIWYDHQCELLQYTGLKDKNGKEIYEGDVVQLSYGFDIFVGEIVYYEACFWIKYSDTDEWLGEDDTEDSVEIIGNKFENPELLED